MASVLLGVITTETASLIFTQIARDSTGMSVVTNHSDGFAHTPVGTDDVDLGTAAEVLSADPCFLTARTIWAFLEDIGCDKPRRLCPIGAPRYWAVSHHPFCRITPRTAAGKIGACFANGKTSDTFDSRLLRLVITSPKQIYLYGWFN